MWILACLILSQRTLKLSSFLLILFCLFVFYLAEVISTSLSSDPLIHSFVSFSSIITFFNSASLVFIFYNFLLKNYDLSLCTFIFLPSSLSLLSLLWSLSSVGFLFPHYFVVLLRFYLVLLSETYSSILSKFLFIFLCI